MGVDIYGKQPTSAHGEYFQRSWWTWRPLVDLCTVMAPDLVAKCKYWQTNDGDGLDKEAASQLGSILQALVDDGRSIAHYISERDRSTASSPEQNCDVCGESFVPDYSFEVDDVREFAAFLNDCGGFAIH